MNEVKKFCFLILCILFISVSVNAKSQDILIHIESGWIEGIKQSGVTVYKAIPYAAPPIGQLRWKKPHAAKAWKGIRKCDTFCKAALQNKPLKGSFYWKEFYQGKQPEYSEDCLYLNVWTPSAKAKRKKLPVIVWIHGGGFVSGYGNETEFDGSAYAQRGVILVTLNYRLGIMGFLSHPLLTAENKGKGSGNYGLFDQLKAIKWVQNNIAAFGGNPRNITVMGQSAGAGCIQVLLSSPLARGLFQRAIIQSGGGLYGTISQIPLYKAEQNGKKMWDAVNIKTLKQMRNYPAAKTLSLQYYAMKTNSSKGRLFGPCIDGELLTENTDNIALKGEELNIPYIIGYTSDDLKPDIMKKAAANWSLLLEKQGKKAAYVYCFSHDLPGEDMPASQTKAFGDMKGAFHSSELWYVFGTLSRCWRPMKKEDYELSKRMIDYWCNFARTGNPNGYGLPEWLPYTQHNPYIQILNAHCLK